MKSDRSRGPRYLREWSAATHRANYATPDLFSARQFKILGIRRQLNKLRASLAIDLEKLAEHELEQIRVELAAQLPSRSRGISAEQPIGPKRDL